MAKRTIPELVQFIAHLLGTPESVERSRSRRLREAGLLSQFGHGRGAAAATAKDAALVLLVAATGVPPLHAVSMARAIENCKFKDFSGEGLVAKDFAVTLVNQLAFFIETGEWQPTLSITLLRDRLMVVLTAGKPDKCQRSVTYYSGHDDAAFARLLDLFGPMSAALWRSYHIDGWAIRDVGNWLHAEDVSEEEQPEKEVDVA